LANLRPRTILLIGFTLFLVWSFPGYTSTDSVNQLLEARSGKFSDAHPPFMSAQWRFLDAFVSGPLLMLLLQGTLFLGGLFVILKRFMRDRAAAITACAILLFPPILTTMGVIWKDGQMAGYLVAGTAAMLQPRLRTRLIGLALIAAACSIRHNAFAAAVPLVFFLFEFRTGIRWWKRTAIAIGAALLAVAAMFVVTKVLTVNPIQMTPAFQDIVGVIAFSDEKSDEELRHALRGLDLAIETGIQERCRKLYELRGPWRITQGDDRLFFYPDTWDEWDALSRAWKDLVLSEPRAYLAHHWDVYRKLIGYDEVPRAPVYNLHIEYEVVVEEIQHNAGHSGAQVYAAKVLYWLDETPLFRPWIYAVVGLVLLVLFVRDRVTEAFITSGLLFELSYFPVGGDPDFRYSHWMITAVVIAAVILFVKRRARSS
jgi:hypothetical protein